MHLPLSSIHPYIYIYIFQLFKYAQKNQEARPHFAAEPCAEARVVCERAQRNGRSTFALFVAGVVTRYRARRQAARLAPAATLVWCPQTKWTANYLSCVALNYMNITIETNIKPFYWNVYFLKVRIIYKINKHVCEEKWITRNLLHSLALSPKHFAKMSRLTVFKFAFPFFLYFLVKHYIEWTNAVNRKASMAPSQHLHA